MSEKIGGRYDTETIDMLFLELSQFTTATTQKELNLIQQKEESENKLIQLKSELDEMIEQYETGYENIRYINSDTAKLQKLFINDLCKLKKILEG